MELSWSNQSLVKQKITASIRYQLPEFEAPAMYWEGNSLVYQEIDGKITRYDTTLGERIYLYTPEAAISPAELRSVIGLDHNLIVAFSFANKTQLLLLENGYALPIYKTENFDIVAICGCGELRVAAAFSDRQIRIFSTIGKTDELARVTVKDQPMCMTYSNQALIIVAEENVFYTWQVDEDTEPIQLQSNQTNVLSRFARHIAFSKDGMLLSVSQSTASVFRITHGDGPKHHPILALFQTAHHAFAVHKGENDFLLVEMASGNEIRLVENKGFVTRFCMDGLGTLLYASSDGTGFLLNCVSGSRCPANAIPLTLAAVAGDPKGGFWIADRLGSIYRVEADGSVHLLWETKLNYSRVQELLCTGDTLVWRGWCDDQTNSGESRPETLMFFEPDNFRPLRLAGRRLFYKSDGFIETVAYDPIKGSLIVIVGNSASIDNGATNGVKGIIAGSIEDFIDEHERSITLDWLRTSIKDAVFGTNSYLYLLSTEGSIYCVDANTWKRRAVLSPSIPFQVISTSCILLDTILLADSKLNPYLCQMENKNE